LRQNVEVYTVPNGHVTTEVNNDVKALHEFVGVLLNNGIL